MIEGVCHCGDARFMHRDPARAGACRADGCSCPAFDNSVLPSSAERLEFGKHRQPAPAAETAPAWPALVASK